MTQLSRRSVMALAASAAPVVAVGSLAQPATAASESLALVHDATLPDARRFARRALALGTASTGLSGDRVRQAHSLLATRPAAVFGMTRASDHLLFAEVAREHGYREWLCLTHNAGKMTHARCLVGAEAFATVAAASGAHWPQAFAEGALGAEPLASGEPDHISDPVSCFSWVLRLR